MRPEGPQPWLLAFLRSLGLRGTIPWGGAGCRKPGTGTIYRVSQNQGYHLNTMLGVANY